MPPCQISKVADSFTQPYALIKRFQKCSRSDAGNAQRQTATRYLDTLTEAGILDTVRQDKTKRFANTRLLALLLTDTEVSQPFT